MSKRTLTQLEKVIQSAGESLGAAFLEIRDRKLYKATHSSRRAHPRTSGCHGSPYQRLPPFERLPRPLRGAAHPQEREQAVRIRMAFTVDGSESTPWLIAAVDEYTEDEHNGLPDFYRADVEKGQASEVRELIVVVPDAEVEKLFAVPQIVGQVVQL